MDDNKLKSNMITGSLFINVVIVWTLGIKWQKLSLHRIYFFKMIEKQQNLAQNP